MSKRSKKQLMGSILLLCLLSFGVVSAEGQDLALRAGLTKFEFTLMNPLVSPWYTPANEFFGTTHVGLATFDSDLTPLPCLAETWDISPDGRSIEFSLVENATWLDGTPVTAEDVKFTYEYWRDKQLYRQGTTLNLYLDDVEVKDEYSGVINLKESYAHYFLRALFPTVYIIPKHIWEKVDDPKNYDGEDAMVGCGPYIFDGYDEDADTVYLKANTDYFEGRPVVDKIMWRHFRDAGSLLFCGSRRGS